MAELTAHQQKLVDGLIENFGDGRLGVEPDGSPTFTAAKMVYGLPKRGPAKELRPDPALAPPGHEGKGAAQPSVEDPLPQDSLPESGSGNAPAEDDRGSDRGSLEFGAPGDISPQGSGKEKGTNPPVSAPSQTAAGREPSRGNEGAGGASSPAPDASRKGAESREAPGAGAVAAPENPPDSEKGAGETNGAAPAPQTSEPAGPGDGESGPQAAETGQQENESTSSDSTDQDAPGSHSGPSLPAEPGAPAPTFEMDQAGMPIVPDFLPVPSIDNLLESQREEAFQIMSFADEEQILQDLNGNALESYLYHFRVSGKDVYGLSWIGAREVVRTFNVNSRTEIRIKSDVAPQFEEVMLSTEVGYDVEGDNPIHEDVPAIACTVYGEDAYYGGGQFGTAEVPKQTLKMWDGYGNNRTRNLDENNRYPRTPQGFARAKALSKAQRNALEPQIPRRFVEYMIAMFKGDGKVEHIEGTGRETTPELPPALTDAKAVSQVETIRLLYAEVKKVAGPTKLVPARFNTMLTAAQHDHDRLDDFIAYLANLIEEAKGSDG